MYKQQLDRIKMSRSHNAPLTCRRQRPESVVHRLDRCLTRWQTCSGAYCLTPYMSLPRRHCRFFDSLRLVGLNGRTLDGSLQ
jgi:hypothetical protein